MDKTILKDFAIYSRNKLIQEISNKASLIGISKDGIEAPLPQSTSDMLRFDIGSAEPYILTGKAIKQYERLKNELKMREGNEDYETAYSTLIEEVAYTWFNRLIAIRFMEVNNYMPNRLRVLSSGIDGVNEPELVTNYEASEFDFTEEEKDQLLEWRMDASASAMEKMFHFLFIKQCNALNDNLPELFEKTDDYAELLLSISYNDKDGVLYKLVHGIPEEYFDVETDDGNGQVEIIGWMYQYYNTVPKEEVDASGKKVDKNTLPHKTQLFTPEWIVKYMVQNSLGRLWIERKIAKGTDKTEEELSKEYGWKYYLPEAEQIDEVEIQLKDIRKNRKELKLGNITFIDSSMGSGHILVYAFDIFMQFYLEEGYMERQAAEIIIENNLYGLDIDKRAYQLAYFAVMMKGRQYSRRILNKEIDNNLYYFIDSKDINLKQIGYLGGNIDDEKNRKEIKKDLLKIVELFKNARELGSIIKAEKNYNFELFCNFTKNINNKNILPMELIGIERTQEDIIQMLRLLEILLEKYNIIVTNPPYLGRKHMGVNLTKYLNKEYPDTKADLFAVFMEKSNEILVENGYYGMINQHSWMFLSSFEKYREKLLSENSIINMLHLGPRTFEEISGEVVQSTSFIIKKNKVKGYIGNYARLVDYNNSKDKESKTLNVIKNPNSKDIYIINQNNFNKIPGSPIAYWVSENFLKLFNNNTIEDNTYHVSKGIYTGKNEYFIRGWHEVNTEKINKDWIIYGKGGKSRSWYGNYIEVLNWKNNAEKLRNFNGSGLGASKYFGNETIVWGKIGSSMTRFRYNGVYGFDDGTPAIIFAGEPDLYLLGYLNTNVSQEIIKLIAPTLNLQIGDVRVMPYPMIDEKYKNIVVNLVVDNIEISKMDWDLYEMSIDFKKHPLLEKKCIQNKIDSSYNISKDGVNSNFLEIKGNEEELNKIFIKIHGLEKELTPEISDKDITITKIFDHKDEIYDDIKGNRYIKTKEDIIKSFISYAVGCMFGRYSLDEEGLVYAGGEWDENKYETFKPTKDNILLITDKEYFEDDIVNRFVEFVEVTYGKETLEENLEFIADSLSGRGTPKEKIRNYFMNGFYKDHMQTYQKTPIYWLYDSSAGKYKRDSYDGFKALIYMHRYDEDTTGKVRIDYLHKLQREYEFRMDNLKYEIENNENTREVAKAEKEFDELTKKLKECKDYDEKIGHLALARIPIDLDDGVKVNYEKIQKDENGKKLKILAKI